MNSNTMEILVDPNPVLRMSTEPVNSFNAELQEIVDRMIFTMRQANGVGLAAPQVGILSNIITIEYQPDKNDPEEAENAIPLTVLINPKISNLSEEKCYMVEGCLSFPEIITSIERPKTVTVNALDRWGKKITIQASGLFARVIQHECDHLIGILLSDHIKPLRTVLLSNMELGLPALSVLKEHPQFDFQALVTSRNRGHRDDFFDLSKTASDLKIKTIFWENDDKIRKQIAEIKPDIIIVAGFGKILKKELIDLPKVACLNIHPSILPKYRGPAPIQATILNGDKTAGVSIIKMSEAVDAGPVLGQIELKLRGNEYYSELLKTLSELGIDLLIDILPYYLNGDLSPEPQDESKATFTKQIKREDGEILKSDTVNKAYNKIRAFRKWPKAYTYCGKRRVILLAAHLDQGKLVIDQLQPEGKKSITFKEFSCGYKEKLRLPKPN
jgi:methionyl-tRNA formyltransferase